MVGVDISYSKYLVELLIFVLFMVVLSKGSIRKNKAIYPFLIVSLTIFLSAIYNNDFVFGSFTFYRPILNSFLVFTIFVNVDFTDRQFVKIFKLISLLVVIQIFASVIKYFLIGKGENWIGTMSYSAGGLNTYYALVVAAYALGFYIYYKKSRKYILLVLGGLFLAWVGRKKGVYFYLVITFLIMYLLHNYVYLKRKVNLLKLFGVGVISILVVYLGVILTPPLNPERKVGGSFDIEYLQNFMREYSYYSEKRDSYSGRIGGNYLLTTELLGTSDQEWIDKNKLREFTYLFGFGPSSFHHDNYLTENENLNTYTRLIPTGYFRTTFSTGFLGELGFILFFGFFLVKLLGEYRKRNKHYTQFGKAILIGTLTSFILIFIDHYTYLFNYNMILVYLIHFFFAAILLKKRPYKLLKNYE
jgi:hypothetical protein